MKTLLLTLVSMLAFAPRASAQTEGEAPAQAPPAAGTEAELGNFQPYIFWAYGLACVLLLLFTVYSIYQTRSVAERVSYLRARLEKAHPESGDTPQDASETP